MAVFVSKLPAVGGDVFVVVPSSVLCVVVLCWDLRADLAKGIFDIKLFWPQDDLYKLFFNVYDGRQEILICPKSLKLNRKYG